MRAYHFTGNSLRNGQPIPPIGEWLVHTGNIDPCVSGLHASEHPFDALGYAPGPMLHRVELDGDLQSHGNPIDKWVGRRRKIIKTIDATEMLRAFARWCALQVIHLWDAPEVVRLYLESGDESLRDASGDASGAASWAASRAVSWDASWTASRAASWDASWAASRAASWAAAWAAAGAASWDASRDAHRNQFLLLVEAAEAGRGG